MAVRQAEHFRGDDRDDRGMCSDHDRTDAVRAESKPGQAMRAVSEDKGAAQLMGINVNGTIALTFAIGSALAAVAGVLVVFGISEPDAVYRSDAGY